MVELSSNREERVAAGSHLLAEPAGAVAARAGGAGTARPPGGAGTPAVSPAGAPGDGSAGGRLAGDAPVGPEGPAQRRPLVVLSARPLPPPAGRPATRWLVRFDGVRSRDDADGLRGARLLGEAVADDEDEDALWVHELVGSTVVDGAGRELGVVTGVLANPASDLLELAGGGLVPLTFVRSHGAGRVVVDVPPGLIG